MIGYAMFGSNNLPRATSFYDAVMAELGAKALMGDPAGGRVYGKNADSLMFGIVAPFNGQPASAGNGTMIAILAETQEQVRLAYAKALELGGQDEGGPGWRGAVDGFYAAYFRDLDGNKLCVYRIGPETELELEFPVD